jgi:hypothetical protein
MPVWALQDAALAVEDRGQDNHVLLTLTGRLCSSRQGKKIVCMLRSKISKIVKTARDPEKR